MDGQCCKVGRVISEYELPSPAQYSGDLNDYLVAKWKGTGHHSAIGYRKLADWFNKHCLQTVYRRHGRSDTKTRLDAEYEALQDDAAPHERQEVIADLQSDDIDGERIAADFISKSTISRHLRECLDTSKEQQRGSADSEWETDQIDYAREQFRERVVEALSSLESKGRIPDAGATSLSVQVMLTCPECPTRVSLDTALEQGYVCADHATDLADARSG